ncbi:MAG: hypothetical protein CAPSK01_000783 [Candidatus Accumulibacter vicinus]|uniref:Uncharacterized protein n=1 Tax=Candidatus Accumulibacter vicinus TaxID=2954382 RepID=A0A084Y476_9PROT|nr:MAG: hypothetical protein CAPSK01_000783 [Candidatus Accumulibacter vicinus]
MRPRAFDRGGKAFQAFTHLRQHRPAFARQLQCARQAVKERKTEVFLKTPDLVADGCGRHGQFLAGILETEMAGRRFEGTQRVQRGQSVSHMEEIFSRIG